MIQRMMCLAVLAVALLGGCGVPQAHVTGRSLSGQLVPPGRMALLPPSYDPRIEYPILADAFIRTVVLNDLVRGGINVSYDDLGGRLQARPLRPQGEMATAPATAPAVAPAPPRELRGPRGPALAPAPPPAPAPQFAAVLADLRQAGYATACLPVIRRYGHYWEWVPTAVYYTAGGWPGSYYGGFYGPFGGYGFGDLDEGEGGEGDEGGGDRDPPAADPPASDPPARVHVGVRYGYGYGYWPWPDYYNYGYNYGTVVPGHYRSAAGIEVEFHIFQVSDGREVYYILADDSSFHYSPVGLEKGFKDPLIHAFRKALGR